MPSGFLRFRAASHSASLSRMTSTPRARAAATRLALALTLLCALSSCSSLNFQRSTETSGSFTSTGFAFTIFAVDIPKSALQIARENASDANLANLQIDSVTVFPYLGPFDWILDIISFRYARVKGTWGFAGK